MADAHGDFELLRTLADTNPAGSSQSAKRLRRLLDAVLGEVQDYASIHLDRLRQQERIGLALSSERNIDRLLEMIVDEARRLTHADAGTLYTVNDQGTHLDFMILQNDTMAVRQGGASGVPVTLPPVPLEQDGKPNLANVSSYVAITGTAVNIPDVYEAEGYDFTGPRKYDQATGYRSRSMLVIPLVDHEARIIGVLQLLNAKDPDTGAVIAFHQEYVDMTASLASQAAVALTNARLVRDLQDIFNAFIKSIATAIDCKSPYTGGHVRRVVTLTMMLAEEVNQVTNGPLAGCRLGPEEMEELRLAAWLHDVGKITTPEYVVDKRTKLETVCDRSDMVAARFDLAAKCLEAQALRERLALHESGAHAPEAHRAVEDRLARDLAELAEDKAFVLACNQPGEFLKDEAVARLTAVAAKRLDCDGAPPALVTEGELANLCIRKGTLNDAERRVIEDHTTMTRRILGEIPFSKKLARVPSIAASHHEKLDGTGYPDRLAGEAISLQARMVAIADIFEALTARDRPYKKAMSLEQALKILGFMKKDGHIDPDLYELFVTSGIPEAYAAQEFPDRAAPARPADERPAAGASRAR